MGNIEGFGEAERKYATGCYWSYSHNGYSDNLYCGYARMKIEYSCTHLKDKEAGPIVIEIYGGGLSHKATVKAILLALNSIMDEVK